MPGWLCELSCFQLAPSDAAPPPCNSRQLVQLVWEEVKALTEDVSSRRLDGRRAREAFASLRRYLVLKRRGSFRVPGKSAT